MRKFFIAACAVFVLSIASQASATQAPIEKMRMPQAVVVNVDHGNVDTVAAGRGPVRNILRGLLELERRKNAWLRRTFLRG